MLEYLTEVLFTLFFLFLVRLYIVYLRIHKPRKLIPRPHSPTVKLMIVLGSGGHTFEMLRLIKYMTNRYRPRIYIIADSDEMSERKVASLEELTSNLEVEQQLLYQIEKIPRSREVSQPWLYSAFTTAYSCLQSIAVLYRHMPDVILCNGPGTCVPLCLTAVLFHVLGLNHIKTIYVESICRVESMSLSGKILYYIADHFLVQWPQLKEKYPRCKYLGRLI